MSKRLLVTGGSGFIGSNLVRYLLNQLDIERVVNLDALTYAGNPVNLADQSNNDKYLFQKGLIQDRALVSKLLKDHGITHVLNLAAESHVDRSIEGPDAFVQTNIVGTFELLEACRNYKKEQNSEIRLLHVSTDEVFGSLGNEGKFTEYTPYAPNSPYAASKASSDMLVRSYQKTYGLHCVITNCSNNYGPYQFPEKLIPLVIMKAILGESIPIYGKGDNIRDWLYVSDHAEALYKAAVDGVSGETYNIGGDQEVKNLDLVKVICGVLDKRCPKKEGGTYTDQIEFVQDRPGHDFRYAIDASKIKNELGWSPKHDIQSGIESTIQWYLDNNDWCEVVLSRGYELQRLGL
jgi:dTDP-glucose 4,6-dehydratase